MSLVKLMEIIKKRNYLKYPQRGTVVDRDDPEKAYRVKVTIPGVYETNDPSLLPWVTFFGDKRSMRVPHLGDVIRVFFPMDGDPHLPFYRDYWIDGASTLAQNELFGNNYPHPIGTVDNNGNYFKIDEDEATLDAKFNDTNVQIDKDGNTSLTYPNKLTVEIEKGGRSTKIKGDTTLDVNGSIIHNASDDFTLESGGTTAIKSGSGNVELNGNAFDSARKTDTVNVPIPALIVTVGTPAGPGSGTTAPITVTGIIDSGNSRVKQ